MILIERQRGAEVWLRGIYSDPSNLNWIMPAEGNNERTHFPLPIARGILIGGRKNAKSKCESAGNTGC
jgi:hypothetical protein